MSGQKIIEGARQAAEFARVERAVMDWIRDDAPLAAKMNLTPQIVRKLVARITGSTVAAAFDSEPWPTPRDFDSQ